MKRKVLPLDDLLLNQVERELRLRESLKISSLRYFVKKEKKLVNDGLKEIEDNYEEQKIQIIEEFINDLTIK